MLTKDLILVGVVHDYFNSGFVFYNKNDKNFYRYHTFLNLNRLFSEAWYNDCDSCYISSDISTNLNCDRPINSSINWTSSDYRLEKYSCSSTYFPLTDSISTKGTKIGGYRDATDYFYPDEYFHQNLNDISEKLEMFDEKDFNDNDYKKTVEYINRIKEKIKESIFDITEIDTDIEDDFFDEMQFDDELFDNNFYDDDFDEDN